MDSKINELVTAMITLYHDDPKRIHHFMKVYAFASAIAQSEHLMHNCNCVSKPPHWYMISAFMQRNENTAPLQVPIKRKKVRRLPVPCCWQLAFPSRL